MPASIASADEEAMLIKTMDWMESKGLPRGEFGYELIGGDSDVLATLDLAWPAGVQTGRSQMAALLIDEPDDTLEVARNSRGYHLLLTNFPQLQHYVQHDILGEFA